MGFTFSVQSAGIDETPRSAESPLALVERLALEKAEAVYAQLDADSQNDTCVLAADTIVVAQQRILGKPSDKADFEFMMGLLSDAEHQVLTAIAGVSAERRIVECIATDVTFCPLSQHDIEHYWASQEPKDKAGGYGIQGLGGQFVSRINGSYSSVVGLPMVETRQLLERFGVQR